MFLLCNHLNVINFLPFVLYISNCRTILLSANAVIFSYPKFSWTSLSIKFIYFLQSESTFKTHSTLLLYTSCSPSDQERFYELNLPLVWLIPSLPTRPYIQKLYLLLFQIHALIPIRNRLQELADTLDEMRMAPPVQILQEVPVAVQPGITRSTLTSPSWIQQPHAQVFTTHNCDIFIIDILKSNLDRIYCELKV